MRIAISGKMGAGKNAVYEILKLLNPELFEVKFASPLYECMEKIQNILSLPYIKDGAVLQFLGEHYRDKYGSDFFAKKLFTGINETDSYCITDLRFPAEFNHARKNGFKIIRVIRPESARLEHSAGRDLNHHTETALDELYDSEFDAVINNSGKLDELENNVRVVYRNLFCSNG